MLSQLSYAPTWCVSPDVVGLGRLELPTSRLSGVRSSHLSYRPVGSALQRAFRLLESEQRVGSFVFGKGGDPAAGSPTATLLRLHPSYQPLLGRLPPLRVSAPTSGAIDSHGVTGGVYKARERIHRGMLIRDY